MEENKDEILVIMGNGPSLKDVNFEKIKKYHTFGLNSAYRKYSEINFYPTYFGCFDYIVCNHHSKNFSNLVENSPIKRFFFLEPNYFNKKIQDNEKFQMIKFIYPRKAGKSTFDNFIDMGCSGTNAVQVGILLGYTKIILIGCDANYIDYVDGAKNDKGRLIMSKTPDKNQNYWFNDYQRTGDVYNIPSASLHLKSWKYLSIVADIYNIDIVNCSEISKINCFRKSTLEKELKEYNILD